jgi:MFS-type transporter involved in bile tolerance (Atg22 family)
MSLINFTFFPLHASVVLNGPEKKNMTYLFAILWGIGLGWLHPQHIAVYGALIPSGQEAELMGVFLFCTYVIGWLPPLVFSALNEGGISMAMGLASLAFFFLIAIIFLVLMVVVRKTWMVSTLHNLSGTSTTNGISEPVDTELQDLQLKESQSDSDKNSA